PQVVEDRGAVHGLGEVVALGRLERGRDRLERGERDLDVGGGELAELPVVLADPALGGGDRVEPPLQIEPGRDEIAISRRLAGHAPTALINAWHSSSLSTRSAFLAASNSALVARSLPAS